MKAAETIKSLEDSKRFIDANSNDLDEDTIIELKALLSAGIQAVRDADESALESALSELDQLAPAGWDLTSQTRLHFLNGDKS